MKKIIVLSLIGITTLGACVVGFVLSVKTQEAVTQVLSVEVINYDEEYYESYLYVPIDGTNDDY